MMAADRSSKLASDLATREKRFAELQAEQDRIATAISHVAELRDQAADAELAGDLASANRLRGEATKLENEARARESELASLVPRSEALIEKTKQDLERATFEEALARPRREIAPSREGGARPCRRAQATA